MKKFVFMLLAATAPVDGTARASHRAGQAAARGPRCASGHPSGIPRRQAGVRREGLVGNADCRQEHRARTSRKGETRPATSNIDARPGRVQVPPSLRHKETRFPCGAL